MKRETLIWTGLLVLGLTWLVVHTARTGCGRVFVQEVTKKSTAKDGVPVVEWKVEEKVARSQAYVQPTAAEEKPKLKPQLKPGVSVSWSRTVGVWVAALLTLSAFSFLYGDNPFFKIAQALVVGVSAGYSVVVGFWTVLVPNLLGKLLPQLMHAWALPGINPEDEPQWKMLFPLILSVLLLWRLSPVGGWISRWPLAFFIGLWAGYRFVTLLKADFVDQISNTLLPLVVMLPTTLPDGTTQQQFHFWLSVRNVAVLTGVLSSLVYFFFSLEHKGVVGKVSRVGIGVLMITFGASFASTVMTRITLLSRRLEFLFDDWLWLVDALK